MSDMIKTEFATGNAFRPLIDSFGRVHRALRVSVTDVCNIRCQYCMPADGVQFLPQDSRLSYEKIAGFVEVAARCGIRKLRLTGGEPLTRPRLFELIERLAQIEGMQDLALTTNGMLLSQQLSELVRAGLKRINISLDTLSDKTFKTLSRRDGLERVIEGIEATAEYPDLEVKLNALVLRDVNLVDVVELIHFSRHRRLPIRFIEFMPLDGGRTWTEPRMVSGRELRELIAREIGPLRPVAGQCSSQPSVDYEFVDGTGQIGFIDSVSQPFCGGCDRMRLTAEGRLRNCLFSQEEWDVAQLLNAPTIDAVAVAETMRSCIFAKHASHGIAEPGFKPPVRAMYQIGG